MAIFTSVKKGLESNVEFLRNKRGFFADVAYAINQTLADLTPDTVHGSTTDHFKMAAQSLGETVKSAGEGIKQALWNEKNEFVAEVVERSGIENSLGQAGLATFYTGFYYLKSFTYDAAVNTAKGFYYSAQAIANGESTEETLLGVSQLYGTIGAAAGIVAGAGGAGHIASKIGPTIFVVPMINGSEVALAAVTFPTGSLVAAAIPGGIGTVMMSAQPKARRNSGKREADTRNSISEWKEAGKKWADLAQRAEKLLDDLDKRPLERFRNRDAKYSLKKILDSRKQGVSPEQTSELMDMWEECLKTGDSFEAIARKKVGMRHPSTGESPGDYFPFSKLPLSRLKSIQRLLRAIKNRLEATHQTVVVGEKDPGIQMANFQELRRIEKHLIGEAGKLGGKPWEMQAANLRNNLLPMMDQLLEEAGFLSGRRVVVRSGGQRIPGGRHWKGGS